MTQEQTTFLEDLCAGGGEMGAAIRAFDWSKTCLGALTNWPLSLRTAVSICLNSRFPMVIWWGKDLVLLYNDAWCPILGSKHPQALGKPGREVWPEIWDIIGTQLESVLSTGQATWADDMLLLVDRYGYTEEAYFTYSYSPIFLENGEIGGAFTAVTETTQRVIGQRRLGTLRDLSAKVMLAKNVEQACGYALETLANNSTDIPFVLLYMIDEAGEQAQLQGATGINSGTPISPQVVDLWKGNREDENRLGIWPFTQVVGTGEAQLVENLEAQFGYSLELANSALVLPIAQLNQKHPAGLLVVGINPRRALDEDYRSFFDLITSHVANAIANARAYEEERKRAEALAELDRAKTVFFSNVSHEFRTPLTLMLAPLQDMLVDANNTLTSTSRFQLQMIHRNGLRLLKLVNILLDFSRIEAGRIQAVYEPTDLATFTADLASVFRSAIEQAGMRLIVDCPPLPELVYVDREMWEKIVLNLLSNAFKFTFEGEITVRLYQNLKSKIQNPKSIVLEVRDTGIGIPESEIPHLFERFYRVKGAKGRTYEGSGIGLSLVQELVQLHGGTIQVQSVEGKGSNFTVSIPTGFAHLPQERIGATRTQASTGLGTAPYLEEALRWLPQPEDGASGIGQGASGIGQGASGIGQGALGIGQGALGIGQGASGMGKKTNAQSPIPNAQSPMPDAQSPMPNAARILLADDNADMREYVKSLLSQMYEVEAVADGVAALAAVRRQSPDLVLTDVMMPELDGFELLRELRNNPSTREIPIILLSARAGEESRVEGLQAGADDYLIKPFSARELLARIEANLKLAKLRQETAVFEQQLRVEAETARTQITNILESITDAFVAFDNQWRYTYVNREAARLLQKTPEELLGKELWQVFPDLVGTLCEREFRRAVTEQVTVEFEDCYPPLNIWAEVRAYPSSEGLAVYVRDISEQQAALRDRKIAEETLRQSEERLRVALKNSPISVFNQDKELRYTWLYNPTSEHEIEDVLGKRDEDLLPSTDAEVLTQIKQRVLDTGIGAREEVKLTIHGRDYYYDLTVEPLRDGNNEIIGVTCASVDISERQAALRERKIAEEILRQTDERLRVALKNSPITVLNQDRELRYTWVYNPTFDYKVDEVLGKRDVDLVSREDAEILTQIKRRVIETGVGAREEVKLTMLGQEWYYDLTVEPLRDANNEIFGITCAAVDISDRKQANQALRQSEHRFRVAQELSLDAFTVLQSVRNNLGEIIDFEWTYVNPKAAEILCRPAEELVGQRLLQVLPGNKANSELFQRYVRVVETGQPHDIEIYYNADGICGWFRNMAVKLGDGVAISFSDITQRKRDEAERLQLLERERAARQEAEAANRIKDEFLAVLSHELRSPLNPILGWAKLLRTRSFDAKAAAQALETIERNAKLQAQLIEDLLDVSRILRGKLVLNVSEVNLENTIEAALETVRLAAEAKNIQIHKVFDPENTIVSGDTSRLQQIVWNLLSNAIKFTPNGGQVEIRLEKVGTMAQIQVKDTGKGIKQDFLPYVFEYFRQESSSTTRKFGGLGLGLAIVRYLTELHGGCVQAESLGEGQGATFIVKLPLLQAKAKAGELGELGELDGKCPNLEGIKVLIVDDEADMRELVGFILEQFGAEVTVAASAAEALLALQQQPPNILISDIGMPDVDGYMLMQQIRKLTADQGGQIPAIALTAYAGEYNQKRAIAAGFQMHISKPVEPEELLKIVTKIISNSTSLIP